MLFLGEFFDQFPVTHHRDNRYARDNEIQRPIIETGAPSQSHTAEIDRQSGDEHHLAARDGLRAQNRSRGLGQTIGSRPQTAAAYVLCPVQRPWFTGYGNQDRGGYRLQCVE